jgi:D-alanyl-D-alanine carboxypeptidase (penicillin-binding protein 5/6)
VHTRRFVTWLAVATIGLGLLGFRPPASLGSGSTEALAGGALYAASVSLAGRPPAPSIGASAAAVVDGETGSLLWGNDPHGAFAPASMTKMMTALVAIERGRLDQVLTSDVDATSMVGDSVMGLHRGERLPLSDLLYGMLVPSGGDAALVIARAIGGDAAAFVAQMNDEAARLGLTETRFVNPDGLDADAQLSSPYDMIVVARAAMRFPFFRKVVATKHIVITGQWTYDLTNTNYFLGRRPDVVGVKTGTTERALHAITVADDVDGHLLYVTVMHTPDYVPDISALLDYARTYFRSTPLVFPSTPLGPVDASAASGRLAIDSEYRPFLGRWAASTLSMEEALTPNSALRATDNPDLPSANDGVATFYAGGERIARLPLTIR